MRKSHMALLMLAVIAFSAASAAIALGDVKLMSHDTTAEFERNTVGAGMTVNITLRVTNSGSSTNNITEVVLYEPGGDLYDYFSNLTNLTPPTGWKASKGYAGGVVEFISWSATDSSHYIKPGESMPFDFSVKTPAASGGTYPYTWTLSTYDEENFRRDKTLHLTVDATPPQIGNLTPNSSVPVYTKCCQHIRVNFTTDSSAKDNPYNITIYRSGDVANITAGDNITADANFTNGSDNIVEWGFLIHINTTESCNYTVRVTVEDEYGNKNTTEEENAVIIDNKAPTVEIKSPTLKKPYILPAGENNVTVCFNVYDNKALRFYNISVGGEWCNGTINQSQMRVECNISSVSEGRHNITVYASDKSGNEGNDTEINAVLVDKTPPSQVTNLTVEYNEHTGYMDLRWDAASDDRSGIAYYRIYRNDTGCSNLTADLVATNVSSTSWTDTEFLEDRQTYYYVVTAVDRAGNENTTISDENCDNATYTVRYYEISLSKGWNLISLPLIPDNESIEDILSDCIYEIKRVYAYDAANKTWLEWDPFTGGSLRTMTTGRGYWIKANDTCTFRYKGSFMKPRAVPPTYALVEGWNLIGFHSLRTNVTPAQYLEGVRYTEPLFGYEDGRWILYCDEEYCDRRFLEIGKGYWVYVTHSGTIVPHEL